MLPAHKPADIPGGKLHEHMLAGLQLSLPGANHWRVLAIALPFQFPELLLGIENLAPSACNRNWAGLINLRKH